MSGLSTSPWVPTSTGHSPISVMANASIRSLALASSRSRAVFWREPLFEVFDMLMREETRHIVFFINWMAWHQATRGRIAGWLRGANAARYYARAIARLLATVRRGRRANDGKDFSATQAS